MALRISRRNRQIKKLIQPHSGRYGMNEAILIPFCSNLAVRTPFLGKLKKLRLIKI